MQPLISVIIPVYNVAPYLRRCVDSLLVQTFRNFELILVDDGSSDGSGDICEEYSKLSVENNNLRGENRNDSVAIEVNVIHQPNAGVSTARNRGIEAAEGHFISFVDADDWVEPTFLQAFADEVEKHPNVDCVLQGFVDHEGKSITWPEAYYSTAEELCSHLFELEQQQLIGYVWNKLYRRVLIQQPHLRFDSDIPIGEDEVFVMSFLNHATSLATISQAGYYYVFNGEKTYSFIGFNKRLDRYYDQLCSMKSMSSEVRNAFLLKEFRFSLYVLHVLYKEHRSTSERLSFLQKIRSRIHPCKQSRVLSQEYPYWLLAFMAVYLPHTISDFLFMHVIYRG